ncbi:beta-ketoacyl-ACP synthase II [Conexibacter sp. DBS9H8]|uniref:beta-ketoacyl-ACP synthase II n=1 Tax=Conexibacter sp. DBS9H8 TaxID=2937801 RepID=UPI00200E28E5|nr:beta-ketoacyl-ACP synthase II [Conexibacter sp. DBS9H8]
MADDTPHGAFPVREVVITGVGAVTPLGLGARTLHERWSAGQSGITAGEGACGDFNPTDFMSRKDARRADRFTQLALAAGAEALAEAGWSDERPYHPDRVGSVIGSGIGGIGTIEQNHTQLQGERPVSPLAVPLMMGNAGAAALSLRYDLQGPVFGVMSACAAGGHAIGTAARLIQHGDADAVVTGGAEAALTPLTRAAFSAMNALSVMGVSRPFDARRDGFVLSEGSAVLVLEDGDLARARGARILGVVRGYGMTGDAHHLTAPDTEGRGGAKAIAGAMRDAGIGPADVTYVNAHGTSTPLNDRSETAALKHALGDFAPRIPVSSTKSAIGHTLGASGAIEAVAMLLALRDGIAPPTLGWEEAEDGLDLDYVPNHAKPLCRDRPRIGLSNSFGFGGHNVTLCLEGTPA